MIGTTCCCEISEQRLVLLAAGAAPGSPHVEHVHLPLERRIAHDARRIHHVGERERRRRFADQRRGQRVDVAVGIEAKRKQHGECDECRKRQQELPHQADRSLGSGPGGAATASAEAAPAPESIAPIRGRHQTADRHHESAQPNIAHQRLVLDAHAPGALAQGVAHRDEQVARPVHRDRGLAVVGLLYPEMALLRLQDRDRACRRG